MLPEREQAGDAAAKPGGYWLFQRGSRRFGEEI